jgi:uncharacterized protein YbjT (DUF2867 family)
MRIPVTGATGHVGPQLISQVLERGHSGRAIVRNRSNPPDLGKDVEIFAGDLTDAETLRPALVGVDGVYLLSGYDDDGLVRQLRAAGVSRAALLSSSAAPTGDIAAVATVALLADAPESRAYRITGPEALHAGDRVAILGEVLGRRLPFEQLSNDDARREMSANMPPEYVDAFFDFFVAGSIDETTVLPTVTDVTGRPPRTFQEWAQEHAARISVPRPPARDRRSTAAAPARVSPLGRRRCRRGASGGPARSCGATLWPRSGGRGRGRWRLRWRRRRSRLCGR